jgi:hypothetical protein
VTLSVDVDATVYDNRGSKATRRAARQKFQPGQETQLCGYRPSRRFCHTYYQVDALFASRTFPAWNTDPFVLTQWPHCCRQLHPHGDRWERFSCSAAGFHREQRSDFEQCHIHRGFPFAHRHGGFERNHSHPSPAPTIPYYK